MASASSGWSIRSIPGDVEVLIDLPADVTFSKTQDQPGLKEAAIIVSGHSSKVIADLEKLHATIGECLSYLNRRNLLKPLKDEIEHQERMIALSRTQDLGDGEG